MAVTVPGTNRDGYGCSFVQCGSAFTRDAAHGDELRAARCQIPSVQCGRGLRVLHKADRIFEGPAERPPSINSLFGGIGAPVVSRGRLRQPDQGRVFGVMRAIVSIARLPISPCSAT